MQKSLTLHANITDDKGVTQVEVFLDNKLITAKGTGPWDFPLALPAGKHTIRVEARDAASKKGSAAVTVFVQGQSSPGSPAPDPPLTPGPAGKGYAESCQVASECESTMCANDITLNQQYCTRNCDETNPCPLGSDCFSALDGRNVCAPLSRPQAETLPGQRPTTEGMSCSMMSSAGTPDLLSLLLLLGLWAIRRRC